VTAYAPYKKKEQISSAKPQGSEIKFLESLQFDDQFYIKLNEMCKRLQIKPEDMLLIMFIESGFDAKIKNPAGAIGLNQFLPTSLIQMGYGKLSPSQYEKLSSDNKKKYRAIIGKNYAKTSAYEQLDWIERFFSQNPNVKSPAQLYLYNFLPITQNYPGVINKNRETLIAQKDSKKEIARGLSHAAVYAANSGLDFNKDRKITYGDIEDLMASKAKSTNYNLVLSQFNKAISKPSAIPVAPTSKQPTPPQTTLPEGKSWYEGISLDTITRELQEIASKFN
jgi:hypothetical protein